MKNSNRPIINWLLTGCFLIFIMVAIGGLTRLTHSGLSMVEWTLFGSTPPNTEADWQILFDKYKAYPEYQQVNFNFSLDEFKTIFYWEYGHRMFGRLIGLVFIIPFIWFLIRRKISKSLLPKLILLLAMGSFQGLLGWYMVKSGLIKNPDVSHYRLAMHLVTAFLTFAYTFWLALSLKYEKTKVKIPSILTGIRILFPILIIQILWGAYVAGLNAGKVYNHWPKMGEDWIASSVFSVEPMWRGLLEGIGGVQFVHRYLAYLVVGLVIFLFLKARRHMLDQLQKRAMNFLIIAVSLQFLLGIFTLLYAVPISLGLLHQLGAFVLLGSTIFAWNRFSYK